MENNVPTKRQKSTVSSSSMVPIRISKETRRRILSELARLNKKDFGRKVKPDEMIALAVSQLEAKHYTQLQEATLSNADRLQRRYLAYIKEHGAISKDEFLGKFLSATVNIPALDAASSATSVS